MITGPEFSNFEQSAIVNTSRILNLQHPNPLIQPQSIVTSSDFTFIPDPHQVQNPNATALRYSSVFFRQNPRLLPFAIHQILRPKVKVTASLEQAA